VGSFAQALDFGSPIPELVVINLIVDDGDKERSNRNNMLSNKFKIIGIAHGEHHEFKSSTVIIYCEAFYSKHEESYKNTKQNETKEKKSLSIVKRQSFAKEYRSSIMEIMNAMKIVDEIEDKYKDNRDSNAIKDNLKKVDKSDDEDEEMEEDVIKMIKSEKIVQDGNKKVKIITITKTMQDGSIVKEKKKEFL